MLGVCAREKLNAPIDGRMSSTAQYGQGSVSGSGDRV